MLCSCSSHVIWKAIRMGSLVKLEMLQWPRRHMTIETRYTKLCTTLHQQCLASSKHWQKIHNCIRWEMRSWMIGRRYQSVSEKQECFCSCFVKCFQGWWTCWELDVCKLRFLGEWKLTRKECCYWRDGLKQGRQRLVTRCATEQWGSWRFQVCV